MHSINLTNENIYTDLVTEQHLPKNTKTNKRKYKDITITDTLINDYKYTTEERQFCTHCGDNKVYTVILIIDHRI